MMLRFPLFMGFRRLRPHMQENTMIEVTWVDMAVLSWDHTAHASTALCILFCILHLKHISFPPGMRNPFCHIDPDCRQFPSCRSNRMFLPLRRALALPPPQPNSVHDASATLSIVSAGKGRLPSPARHEQARVALGHPGVHRLSRPGHYDACILLGPLQHHRRVLQPRL